MILIKTPKEVAAMREGGQVLAKILHELALMTKPGITTKDLDRKAEALIHDYNVLPSFKGYNGFPAVICTSINEEVVHTIPGNRVIKNGDIISIDGGVIHKGFHSDAAVTVMVGNVSEKARDFVKTCQRAFEAALPFCKPGGHIGDIGAAVQKVVESKGYSVVRDYIGHGVGRSLHEEPEVPNFGKAGHGPALIPGMVIAIEPIITMGSRFTKTLPDKWTVVSQDGSLACQVEHTIAITPTGYEVLTAFNNTTNSLYTQ